MVVLRRGAPPWEEQGYRSEGRSTGLSVGRSPGLPISRAISRGMTVQARAKAFDHRVVQPHVCVQHLCFVSGVSGIPYHNTHLYRGTSLIRKIPLLGPYSSPIRAAPCLCAAPVFRVPERDCFIDNLMVRIHFIIVMMR